MQEVFWSRFKKLETFGFVADIITRVALGFFGPGYQALGANAKC